MKFRKHLSSFEESMQTVTEIESYKQLLKHVQDIFDCYPPGLINRVNIIRNGLYDERNGWTTYVVTFEDFTVVGYVDTTEFKIKSPSKKSMSRI